MLGRVVECQALEAPQMSQDARGVATDYTSSPHDQTLKLLTTDWLVPKTDIPA
ncbi:hypothetical protein BJY52DRAFT_1279777, partial [Lactarius psammicola]